MFAQKSRKGFPKDFSVQRIRCAEALAAANLPDAQMAVYFSEHPQAARAMLLESYDKRFTPSTYIREQTEGFEVGWYSSGCHCVQSFLTLEDAATDYLLFSLGKGRWNPTGSNEE